MDRFNTNLADPFRVTVDGHFGHWKLHLKVRGRVRVHTYTYIYIYISSSTIHHTILLLWAKRVKTLVDLLKVEILAMCIVKHCV